MPLRKEIRRRWRRIRRNALGASPLRLNVRPDFLVIGAQKSGTTSLYWWLASHPDVLRARRKELHFFDLHYASEPLARYWTDFPSRARVEIMRASRRRNVVTGEATPYYLFHPLVPERVSRHLPDVKLIAILRDPVERAVSHYWMERNRRAETLPLRAALDAERERLTAASARIQRGEPDIRHQTFSYLARGMYAEQLERWFEHFPRDRLLLIRFDRLLSEPSHVFGEVLRFLGVETSLRTEPELAVRMAGLKGDTDCATIQWMREYFREPNERLAELVGIDFNDRTGR